MIAYCEAAQYDRKDQSGAICRFGFDIYCNNTLVKSFTSDWFPGNSHEGEIAAALQAYRSEYRLTSIYSDYRDPIKEGVGGSIASFDLLAKRTGFTDIDRRNLGRLVKHPSEDLFHQARHNLIHNRLRPGKLDERELFFLGKKGKIIFEIKDPQADAKKSRFKEYLKDRLPKILAKNRDKSANRALFLIRQEFEAIYNV
mgnify:FL=1